MSPARMAAPAALNREYHIMAKSYYGQANDGTRVLQAAPSASGPVKILVYKGPTLGNQWDYSGAVNGTTTLYVVENGPTLGRQRSTS